MNVLDTLPILMIDALDIEVRASDLVACLSMGCYGIRGVP